MLTYLVTTVYTDTIYYPSVLNTRNFLVVNSYIILGDSSTVPSPHRPVPASTHITEQSIN